MKYLLIIPTLSLLLLLANEIAKLIVKKLNKDHGSYK